MLRRMSRSVFGHPENRREQLFGDDQFRNTDGWSYQQSGATLQFADLDGDLHADACARRWDGLWCVEVP